MNPPTNLSKLSDLMANIGQKPQSPDGNIGGSPDALMGDIEVTVTKSDTPKPKGGARPGSGRPRKGSEKAKGAGRKQVIVRTLGDDDDASEVVVHQPTFTVTKGMPTVEAAIEANAPALLDDAMERAARAGTSGDSFDKAVYLTLLNQVTPKHRYAKPKPTQASTAKATLAALDRLLAGDVQEDAEWVEKRPAKNGE